MKIVATIEARMTSSRLPGKVLKPALGKPIIAHLINRLRRVPSLNDIVLATTVNKTDDPLEKLAGDLGIKCFRGSEDDVMSRVIGAAESAHADIVVEITGDCIFEDPEIIERGIQTFLKVPCDYLSNVLNETFPGGMDIQIFRLETLKKSYAMTTDPLDREHVTRHIRQHPEIFKHADLIASVEDHWPELQLMLDEPRDYELFLKIMDYFSDKIETVRCREIIHLLREVHPEWLKVNSDVYRKGMNE